MIGLDTNILVRYLVEDDAKQASKAAHLIETRCTEDSPGFINRVVLCELVWVLESAYGYPLATVAANTTSTVRVILVSPLKRTLCIGTGVTSSAVPY